LRCTSTWHHCGQCHLRPNKFQPFALPLLTLLLSKPLPSLPSPYQERHKLYQNPCHPRRLLIKKGASYIKTLAILAISSSRKAQVISKPFPSSPFPHQERCKLYQNPFHPRHLLIKKGTNYIKTLAILTISTNYIKTLATLTISLSRKAQVILIPLPSLPSFYQTHSQPINSYKPLLAPRYPRGFPSLRIDLSHIISFTADAT
jgi:hypothetical protein